MRQILLDTDTCIEIISGRPTSLEDYAEANFSLSAITRFELHSGLAKQNNRKLANRTTAFLDSITCLPFDVAASEAAAGVRLELEAKGKRIGAYDTLFAGHCLALGNELLTGNVREFSRIEGLMIIPLRKQFCSEFNPSDRPDSYEYCISTAGKWYFLRTDRQTGYRPIKSPYLQESNQRYSLDHLPERKCRKRA